MPSAAHRFAAKLLAIALLPALFGCSSMATIHGKDGNEYRGKFVGSDDENYYFIEEHRSDGQEGIAKISKADVEEVDHPGTASTGLGVLLAIPSTLLFGTAVTLGIVSEFDDSISWGAVYTVTAFPVVVAAIMIWSGVSRNRSSKALQNKHFDLETARPKWSPTVAFSQDGASIGLSFSY